MRRQLAAALLGAALLTGGAQAVAEPPAARYVADEADVLSSETEQYIIDKNQSLFENTGGEIVVVSVDFMDGMDAADYAMAVAESWGGIGDESLNNGFLLVYAVGENKVWAMAGSGIEDALPASKIEGWLEADFYGGYDAGEYDSATRAFFDDVYGWYESYYGTSAGTVVPSEPGRDFGYYPEPENDFVFAVVGQMGLFLLILLVVVVVCAADGWRYRRYRRRYLLPGMPPPPYVYRPFIFGRPGPARHRPQGPRPPMGGGFRPGGAFAAAGRAAPEAASPAEAGSVAAVASVAAGSAAAEPDAADAAHNRRPRSKARAFGIRSAHLCAILSWKGGDSRGGAHSGGGGRGASAHHHPGLLYRPRADLCAGKGRRGGPGAAAGAGL